MEYFNKKREHRKTDSVSKSKNLGYLFIIIVIIGIILFMLS